MVDAAERNADWVSRKRDNVDFAPKDAERIRSFLSADRAGKKAPLEKLAAALKEREKQRIAALQATDVTLTGGRGRGSDGTSDSEDGDDDDAGNGGGGGGGGDDDEFDDDEEEGGTGTGTGGDDDDDDDEFDGMEDEDVLAALASRAGAAGGTTQSGGLQVLHPETNTNSRETKPFTLPRTS